MATTRPIHPVRDRGTCTKPTRSARPTHRRRAAGQRGIAMLLVLIALAISFVMVLTFSVSHATSTQISQNISRQTQARQIAESALSLAIREINSNANWRTERSNGVWYLNKTLLNGTVTVTGEDGTYDATTGTVVGDGDLANITSDKVTLTVMGQYQGVTHLVRAVVTPSGTVASARVLMIVGNPASLTALEQSRKALIETWGWSVNTLAGNSTVEAYTAALTDVHVVYVPDDGGSNIAGARLVSAEMGVVFEDGDMNDELGLATDQTSYSGDTIRVVDPTHYITSPFSIGDLKIANSSARAECPSGSIVGGVRPLAWWPGTERRVLAAMDAGQNMSSGAPVAGRRVVSPFSGFNADDLTDDGKTLLKRMLEWSAQSAMSTDAVTALGNWSTSTSLTAPAGEDRLLVVTVGAETHCSLTSLTYGNQPLTLAASAYESTGVGARSFVYYLREVSIAAATDKVLRATWTSGTAADKSFGSRFYKNVNQANPIRTTEWATNAGPPTISTAPVTVSRGDVVISAVRVGMENRPYTWTSPMVEGVEDKLPTSTHTAADYAIGSGVTSVTAAATCSAPNRQAMVTMVIQPRSKSSGSGIIPTLLALYEFDESAPDVSLVGHWPLDDDGSGGALAVVGNITMSGSARIEGYRGDSGAYSGSNSGRDVIVVTNTNSNGGIALSGSATLQGSTFNRPGGNPSNVVTIAGTASISGNRYEQSVQFALPSVTAPTGMPATSGNRTISSNTTISSDTVYGTLTISGGTLTINGDVRIQLTGDLVMTGGEIAISSGSRLRLYVDDDITLTNAARINNISNAVGRFELYQYGGNPDLAVRNTSVISGILRVGRNVAMTNSAVIYGALYVGGTLTMDTTSAVRIDMDRPGFGITPVADATDTNHAQAHDNVAFSVAGARGYTGTSLRFDGTNDFVRVPHHDAYLLNHGTVSFWFYSESLSGKRALVSKDSSDYDTGGQLHIYTDGTTLKAKLQSNGLSPYGSGDDFEATATGLTVNTWYHVTVTFGAGGLRLYRDGTLRQTVTYPGGMGSSSGGIGNYEPWVLGAGTTTSGDLAHLPLNEYFVGRIDDLRIYNAVLDATQIGRIYAGNAPGERTEPSYLVTDSSGMGTPLNLSVDSTQAVSWVSGGGLTLNQSTVLRAADKPDKIRNGVTATGELTIEIIAKPLQNTSTRRLLWYGPNAGNNTNLDIYQNGDRFNARLRTSTTSSSPAALASDPGITIGQSYHILITYGNEMMRIYRDGSLIGEQPYTGNLLSWDTSYGLTIGNLPLGTSPWLGTLERVAIYDRAMNQRQSDNLFENLPPGDGGTAGGDFQVIWVENP